MSIEEAVFVPAFGYDEATDPTVFGKFDPGTEVLPAGFQTMKQFCPLPVDIVFEKDTAVTLRDGTTIYVDVFRPAGSAKVPVVVAWSPYGKSGGTLPRNWIMFNVLGIDQSEHSGLGKFEGPDPAFWCANGYAVCNPDARGVYNSDGDSVFPGEQDGRDCHDLIEWLAVQDWCTGKVAMCGNSYLTISQWFAAAEQPPHLAAIAPWEGMSDIYRDLVMRGGMPDFGFPAMWANSYVGKHKREDLVAEAERYPLMNDLWKSKTARLEQITVPAYVVASYSNLIHTPGTFRGWRQISSQDKWLRIHNTMEWPDFNDAAHKGDLLRFFDHYLKGHDNGWLDTPRVRYSLLDLEGNDRVDVPASEFPPDDVTYAKLYLDGTSQTLTADAPANAVAASYDAQADRDGVSFTVRFDTETNLVGYPKVRLWVESDGWDDMDLFVFLQKLDADGRHLQQFNVPNHGEILDHLTQDGAAILKYKGSNGRLRVSLRRPDDATSTDAIPTHSFDRVQKLEPGEVVPVEIDMFPVGLAFHPGEQLRLVISGYNLLGGVMPNLSTGSTTPQNLSTVVPDNHGRHIIHTGGSHASYLQIPVRAISSFGQNTAMAMAQADPGLQLPAPASDPDDPLLAVFERRKTIRDISPTPLSMQQLSNLLWSGFGVNRKVGPFGAPGRTASSASNSQEIDLYVALADGAYLYDAANCRLALITEDDLRASAITPGQRDVTAAAPVQLIYVVDLHRLTHTVGFEEPGLHDPEVQKSYYYVATGLIAQNVYLFAAAHGLAAWFHNCDRTGLAQRLGLKARQRVLFAQSVGYPSTP